MKAQSLLLLHQLHRFRDPGKQPRSSRKTGYPSQRRNALQPGAHTVESLTRHACTAPVVVRKRLHLCLYFFHSCVRMKSKGFSLLTGMLVLKFVTLSIVMNNSFGGIF